MAYTRGHSSVPTGSIRTLHKIRYGGIYNRTINGFAEPSEESGLAFYDLRFIPQVWTSAEAKDYATAFPVVEQSKAHGIIVIVR